MPTANTRGHHGRIYGEYKKQRRRTGQHFEKQALHPSKVPLFLQVFNAIVSRVGGYNIAVKYIGMSAGTMRDFKEGRLSVGSGRKIVAAWEELKNQLAKETDDA